MVTHRISWTSSPDSLPPERTPAKGHQCHQQNQNRLEAIAGLSGLRPLFQVFVRHHDLANRLTSRKILLHFGLPGSYFWGEADQQRNADRGEQAEPEPG